MFTYLLTCIHRLSVVNVFLTGSVPSKKPCLQTEFTCGNGKCIPSVWRCNNAYECEDQSDEVCSDGMQFVSYSHFELVAVMFSLSLNIRVWKIWGILTMLHLVPQICAT